MRQNVKQTAAGSDFRYPETDDLSLAHDLDLVAKKLADVTRRATRDRELDAAFAGTSPDAEWRARETAEKTAAALDSVAEWVERTESRLSDSARLVSESQERTAGMLTDALGLMTRRLDEIERKIGETQQPSLEAALTAVERVEAQMIKLGQEGRGPAHNAQIEAALRGVEERIAQVSDRIAHGLPRGSRGRPDPRGGLTSAIEEIRSRQSELEESALGSARALRDPALRSQTELLRSLRDDFSRLAGRLDAGAPRPDGGDGASGLRGEIANLRQSVGELPTRHEVVALERAIREIGHRVGDLRPEDLDLTNLAQPLAAVQAEVRRLSETVGVEAKARAAFDVQALAQKLDSIAERDVTPAILERLAGELADMRALVTDLADPQRVRGLAEQVAGLNHQIAQVRRQFGTSDFTALTSAVDEIRTAVSSRPPFDPQHNDRLAGELDRLSGRIDGALAAAGTPAGIELLAERLDRLNDNLGRPSPRGELKPIEDMLRSLAEKVEQAQRPGGDLDGLERQIAHLSERIERSSDQPAFASLERAMGDLLAQMQSLRSETAEAAERAVRSTIIHTLQSLPKSLDPEIGFVQEELADLKASQGEAGKWTQDTFSAVHVTLDKVVARLAALDRDQFVERPEAKPVFDRQEAKPVLDRPESKEAMPGLERQDAKEPKASHERQEIKPAFDRSAREEEARAADAMPSGKQVEDSLKKLEAELVPHLQGQAAASDHAGGPDSIDEILLEPGEVRPKREMSPALIAQGGADAHDIKATFIAAARRAAQAAASDAAVGREKAAPRRSKAARYGDLGRDGGSLARRAKRNLDERRRPILLGIAAIVLALGALQVGGTYYREQSKPITVAAPRTEMKVASSPLAAPPRDSAPRTTGAIEPLDPRALESSPAASPPQPSDNGPSLADIAAREREAALADAAGGVKSKLDGSVAIPQTLERIPNMASIGAIPANAGPANLRQGAIAGDPASVYELASRAAEGRGMTRDLPLAAKLFEKVASHGLVPAQYRIGNIYEKGLGVPRDLPAAKTWYERAADKGNARAMHNLAVLIAEGVGGKPDYAAAIGWFRRAAQHGVRDSQFNLAVLLARGLGTAQDLSGSYTWFSVVAAQGDEDAAKKRDEVGARLAAPDLAAARLAAERWRPETLDKFANEVAAPQGGAEPPQAKQKTSSNGRV